MLFQIPYNFFKDLLSFILLRIKYLPVVMFLPSTTTFFISEHPQSITVFSWNTRVNGTVPLREGDHDTGRRLNPQFKGSNTEYEYTPPKIQCLLFFSYCQFKPLKINKTICNITGRKTSPNHLNRRGRHRKN